MATKFNPNKLDKQELVLITGIGDVLAERIIEKRPFKDVEDLATKVGGISRSQAEELFEIPQEKQEKEKDRPTTGIFKAIAIAFGIGLVLFLGYLIGTQNVRASEPEQNSPAPVAEKADAVSDSAVEESSEEIAEEPEPEINPIPADWNEWLSSQDFQSEVCDPQTYVWWDQQDFNPDGVNGDEYDFVLHPDQTAVLWGTEVTVDGVEYGQAHVVLTEPGRYNVKIFNGAYRVGLDSGEYFPAYWENVLSCLYEGDWTPQIH